MDNFSKKVTLDILLRYLGKFYFMIKYKQVHEVREEILRIYSKNQINVAKKGTHILKR
jgi:hypothetical protein